MLIQAEDYRYQIATITDKNKQEHKASSLMLMVLSNSYKTGYKEDGDVLIKTYDNTKTSFIYYQGAFENEIQG